MKRAIAFLNGSYPESADQFYRQLIGQRENAQLIVAVDGGLKWLDRIGIEPDLLLGDFDSVEQELLSRYRQIESVRYSTDKDMTDGELALRYLLQHGYEQIDICGAIDTNFETDQMLANIFMLKAALDVSRESERELVARLVDHRQYLYLVQNSTQELCGQQGETFSIIPLSQDCRLSIKGAKWELDNETIEFGSSRPLRNQFAAEKVVIEISGVAVVIHRHNQTSYSHL